MIKPDNIYEIMTEKELSHFLEPLGLKAWQYHPVVGSTNDVALEWGKAEAPDWGLVVADRQVKGRGRNNRVWVTQPGSALAFSLVLRPTHQEKRMMPRFTALAALGLIHALSEVGLQAQIKWPNDVLLNGKKTAGVLVEADWWEDELQVLVIGMGVNVKPKAVPPVECLRYPATSVEGALGEPINRWGLLASVLQNMMDLRSILPYPDFVDTWNEHLAFLGEVVPILFPDNSLREMEVLGVTADGRLELGDEGGEKVALSAGEIGIRK